MITKHLFIARDFGYRREVNVSQDRVCANQCADFLSVISPGIVELRQLIVPSKFCTCGMNSFVSCCVSQLCFRICVFQNVDPD